MLWSQVHHGLFSTVSCLTVVVQKKLISWICIVLGQTLEKEYKTINVTYALASKEFKVYWKWQKCLYMTKGSQYNINIESANFGLRQNWVQVLTLPLTRGWSKASYLIIPKLQSPNMENGDNRVIQLTWMLFSVM